MERERIFYQEKRLFILQIDVAKNAGSMTCTEWSRSKHLGDLGAPRVPISHRGASRPPEQRRCALHRARGGGAPQTTGLSCMVMRSPCAGAALDNPLENA